MDDPISALDACVRKKIINNVILGHLKDKTRILVTHAIDFIHLADRIFIMKDGFIVEQGSYESLKETEILKELLKINEINNDIESTQVEKTTTTSNFDEESEEQKIEAFDKLGKVTNENDGKIISEEEEDRVEVSMKTMWTILSLYGT